MAAVFLVYSGSGKTSLLDVIAKRYEGTVHGSVMLNGKRWTMNDVKEHVSQGTESVPCGCRDITRLLEEGVLLCMCSEPYIIMASDLYTSIIHLFQIL